MSGGVPRRVQISRTQRNTPSKSGNVVAKKALVLCSGRRSRRAMCNYVMRRTHAETKKEVGANPWWYDNADVLAAIAALTSYFASLELRFVLVGESETLATDLVPTLLHEHINHYETGRPCYDTLPTAALKSAVDLINSIQLELPIILDQGLVNMRHIVGTVTDAVAHTLATDVTPYGVPISFSSDVEVTAYGSTGWCIPGKSGCKFTPVRDGVDVGELLPCGVTQGWVVQRAEGWNGGGEPRVPGDDNSPYFGFNGTKNYILLWASPSPTIDTETSTDLDWYSLGSCESS